MVSYDDDILLKKLYSKQRLHRIISSDKNVRCILSFLVSSIDISLSS